MIALNAILLILDREGRCVQAWRERLTELGQVEHAREPEIALNVIAERDPDLLVACLGGEGFPAALSGLRGIIEKHPELPVVAVLDPELAPLQRREVLRERILAHVEGGIDVEELLLVARRAADVGLLMQERRLLRRHILTPDAMEMAGSLATLSDRLQEMADSDKGVFLHGEPGSGRLSLARKIHLLSARAGRAFLLLNPTGLTAEECLYQLFGREASDGLGRRGLLEMAAGGSLLIQEAGNLPRPAQEALQAALGAGQMRRVGGQNLLPLRARVMATGRPQLAAAAREGQFNEGLFALLSVFSLAVPPLRDRREDIPSLLKSYLGRYAQRYGKTDLDADPGVEPQLRGYGWPGNTAELRKTVELAVLRSQDGKVGMNHFGIFGIDTEMLPVDYKQAKKLVELDFKRRFFDRLLRISGGRVTQAAQKCGIPRPSLSTMLKEAGIRVGDYKVKVKKAAAGR